MSNLQFFITIAFELAMHPLLKTAFVLWMQYVFANSVCMFVYFFQVGLSRSTTGCVCACLFREFQLTASYEGLVETVPGVNTALLRMDNYQVRGLHM